MDANKFDSKVYCCSNSTRSEAKKLGIFDVIGSLGALIFAAWTTEMVKNHSEYFRNITESSNATLTDLNFLLDLDPEEQDFTLAALLVWCGWSMALGGTLFYAAQMMKQGLLKVWFAVTAANVLLGLFLVVLALVTFQRKIVIAVICFMVYCYKWYELWIVFRLTREIRSGSTIFASSTAAAENGKGAAAPALIILSATPDPVYTIEGQPDTTTKVTPLQVEN